MSFNWVNYGFNWRHGRARLRHVDGQRKPTGLHRAGGGLDVAAARRATFFEAQGAQPQAAGQALQQIARPYEIEEDIRQRHLGGEAKRLHRLTHSKPLKSARAWLLKMALRELYARAAASNNPHSARADLNAWLSWVRRCRLDPFRKLAKTLSERAEAVVRGMTDNRSNAFVEAMNGLLQQAKHAARGFPPATNFIAIAYLRMAKLKHPPAHPFSPAAAK